MLLLYHFLCYQNNYNDGIGDNEYNAIMKRNFNCNDAKQNKKRKKNTQTHLYEGLSIHSYKSIGVHTYLFKSLQQEEKID